MSARDVARLLVRRSLMLREVERIDEEIAAKRAAEIIDRSDTPVYVHAGATLACIEMGGVRCCEFGSDS